MNFNEIFAFIVINLVVTKKVFCDKIDNKDVHKYVHKYEDVHKYEELSEHTIVNDIKVFPYVVAILKMSEYLCAGSLINDKWVITSADSLVTIKDSLRTLRARLGSSNFKKGGIMVPLKYFEVHPSFDDSKPTFDIALVMLATSVVFTSKVYPIGLLNKPMKSVAPHFTVTSWYTGISDNHDNYLKSMDLVKRHRILSVSHLHPTDPNVCSDELNEFDIENVGTLMCLDTPLATDTCERDIGAPVTYKNILRGVVSSWTPEDCDLYPSPTFVVLVSSQNISSWIRSVTTGRNENKDNDSIASDVYLDYYYDNSSSE